MGHRRYWLAAGFALLVAGGASGAAPGAPRTLFGFFPSPPEISYQSLVDTFRAMGQHGDAVLIQRAVPWETFKTEAGAASADISEVTGLVTLARQNNLEPLFVVDPLNGLNRRQFAGLPAGWKPSFANLDVRAALENFALRIVRELHPRFIGLASEINTYQDTNPGDYAAFLTLYREVYARIKELDPSTSVFVTFQWEEINNLMPEVAGGKAPYDIRWSQIEAFEPQLDVWAISTYPFVAYRSAREIPADYYRSLAQHTAKPIAVAEGGYISRDISSLHGTPQDQSLYLRAIDDQLRGRLSFWIHTLLYDFKLESYAPVLRAQGQAADVATLGWFASAGLREIDGRDKPALAVWDSIRARVNSR
jgi:hypothetical protein